MEEIEQISLTNVELVTLALCRRSGASEPVDLEDIAVAAFELAPTKFCWKKYPHQIDISAVRYALKNAAKRKPPLVKGGIKAGYMLTRDGLQLASAIESMDLGIEQGMGGRKGSVEASFEEERARLRKSVAFSKYQQGESSDINQRDFFDFSRINDYFPRHLREKRFLKIENAVSKDEELNELWSYLKQQFLEGGT